MADPAEEKAKRILEAEKASTDSKVEHSILNEPALSAELAGDNLDRSLEYSKWFRDKISQTSLLKSLAFSLLAIIASGPFAILGAVVSEGTFTGNFYGQFLQIAIAAPVIEEMMKIAVTLYIIEKYAYLFFSRLQIFLCVIASAATFAVIENLMYLHIYIRNPSEAIIYWRWTVCTALHISCSAIAAYGLAKIWHNAYTTQKPTQIATGSMFFIIAVALHAIYNTLALIFSFATR